MRRYNYIIYKTKKKGDYYEKIICVLLLVFITGCLFKSNIDKNFNEIRPLKNDGYAKLYNQNKFQNVNEDMKVKGGKVTLEKILMDSRNLFVSYKFSGKSLYESIMDESENGGMHYDSYIIKNSDTKIRIQSKRTFGSGCFEDEKYCRLLLHFKVKDDKTIDFSKILNSDEKMSIQMSDSEEESEDGDGKTSSKRLIKEDVIFKVKIDKKKNHAKKVSYKTEDKNIVSVTNYALSTQIELQYDEKINVNDMIYEIIDNRKVHSYKLLVNGKKYNYTKSLSFYDKKIKKERKFLTFDSIISDSNKKMQLQKLDESDEVISTTDLIVK